mgnify:CR=1 FL=1
MRCVNLQGTVSTIMIEYFEKLIIRILGYGFQRIE